MLNKIFLAILLSFICFSAYADSVKELKDLHRKIEYSFRNSSDAKAIKLSREAVAKAEKIYGKNNVEITKSLVYLAKSLWISKRLEEAIDVQERMLSIREAHYGKGHENTISALMRLGHLYYENRNDLQAKAAYEKLIKIETKLLGSDSYEVAMDKLYLAKVHASMKNTEKAISLNKESLQTLEWLLENKNKLPKYAKPLDVQLTIVKIATKLAELDKKNAAYYEKKYGKVTHLR